MRMIRAEALKLVRRRGLMIWSSLLTIGVIATVETVLVILHAVNPAHHGAAGGVSNFRGAAETLALLGTVTAILVGATAGSQDVANGVFRDLVVTGRSRSTLFNVRVPGALLVVLPMLLIAFAVALACGFLFAGDLPTPSWTLIGRELVYVLAFTLVNLVMAIGSAAFVSARIVIGVLIAWNTAITHILISFHTLGDARKLINVAAVEHFLPSSSSDQRIGMTTATAIIVLLAWAGVFSSAGRWWTTRRDA
jgi:ABC-type transport system involved in multi-copper enzyme maturation permease subunit